MKTVKNTIAVAVIVLAVVVTSITFVVTDNARSNNQPQWTGLAAQANRMCYHNGGVLQLLADQESDEADVVCMNHWSYNLRSDGDWNN